MPPPLTAQCWRQMPAMKFSLDVLSSKCACHKTRLKASLPGCTDCATATTLATNGAEGHLLSCAAVTDSASMGRNPTNLHSTSLCFTWLVTSRTSFAWSVLPRNPLDQKEMEKHLPLFCFTLSAPIQKCFTVSHRKDLWMKIQL